MPESRLRKKNSFMAPAPKSGVQKPNGRFFAPIMVGLLILGLAWVVVYYLTQNSYPIPGLHNWNLLIGFGILLSGFGMLTRWR